jgi:hypothetical protein
MVCIPGSKLGQMAEDRKAEPTIPNTLGWSPFAVAPEVQCLNVLRMVVSSRPSHPSRINVVGHDVAIVGERHLADSALPVLLNNFSIEQLPHFRFGAKLAVSSGMVRIFDTLHPEPSGSTSLLNPLAATARERSMNGTVLIATEFHGPLQDGFSVKKKDVRFACTCEPIASLSTPSAHDGLGGRASHCNLCRPVDRPSGQSKLGLR